MPCRQEGPIMGYDTPRQPRWEEQRVAMQAALDKLTAENDRLREVVIAAVDRVGIAVRQSRGGQTHGSDNESGEDGRTWISSAFYAEITGTQVEHRKHDLARCDRTLITALRAAPNADDDVTINGRIYGRGHALAMLGAVRVASPEQPRAAPRTAARVQPGRHLMNRGDRVVTVKPYAISNTRDAAPGQYGTVIALSGRSAAVTFDGGYEEAAPLWALRPTMTITYRWTHLGMGYQSTVIEAEYCSLCGALVGNRKQHTLFHETLQPEPTG